MTLRSWMRNYSSPIFCYLSSLLSFLLPNEMLQKCALSAMRHYYAASVHDPFSVPWAQKGERTQSNVMLFFHRQKHVSFWAAGQSEGGRKLCTHQNSKRTIKTGSVGCHLFIRWDVFKMFLADTHQWTPSHTVNCVFYFFFFSFFSVQQNVFTLYSVYSQNFSKKIEKKRNPSWFYCIASLEKRNFEVYVDIAPFPCPASHHRRYRTFHFDK